MNNSKTVSFRVPQEIISEIEKEAKLKKISTNILINQILYDYTIFHRHRQRMRVLPVSEEITKMALHDLDDKREELVETIYQNMKEWTLVSKMKFDFHSCMDALDTFCRVSGLGFESSEKDGVYSFIIKHDLGGNFSSLMYDLAEKIFWDLKKLKIESDKTNSTIVIKTISPKGSR